MKRNRVIGTGLILVGGMMVALGLCSTIQTQYKKEATVVEYCEDLVTVEDACGNMSQFFGDGYEVGDKLVLTMHTNYTDFDVSDDRIIDVKNK